MAREYASTALDISQRRLRNTDDLGKPRLR